MPLLLDHILLSPQQEQNEMDDQNYSIPAGCHKIALDQLDLRPDGEIDYDLLHPKPVTDEKNIWFFWHSGFLGMHSYTKRNIRTWHRRFSKHGWTVRVLDCQASSSLNVANFLDITDPGTFPRAFIDGTIGGDYSRQHTSDLVRWPLLLKYGGVYADVGLIQIGDLERLWNKTLGDPTSPFEVLSYDGGDVQANSLTNYFLCSRRDNALFVRCHKLLLELWAADCGKASTDGMHSSPLLKGLPLFNTQSTINEGDRKIGSEEVSKMLTDYIIQGQAMTMVMGLIDEEDDWNGPKYVAEHVYAIEFMVGAQLINDLTAWDGQKAFKLMSLPLPKEGETESYEQKQGRNIVESCLQRSFGFKLAHGFILRVMGHTLGSLWRENEGSDDVPGTYAHWLRCGTLYWTQDEVPPTVELKENEPVKRGPLLREV